MRGIRNWLRRLAPRRVAMVAGALGVLAAAAYVTYRLHGMGIETPVRLPFARWGEVLDLKNPHLVHLTTRGEVFLGAERVSLRELSDRTSADRRPVIVCADADVVSPPGAPEPEAPDARDASFVLASDYFPDKFVGNADEAVKILRAAMELEAKQAEEYRDYWGIEYPSEDSSSESGSSPACDPRVSVADSLRNPDHLTIEVSPTGELWWKGPVGSLGEIGRICIAQADRWTLMRKRIGKESREGPGGRFSTLPFRIRAGRNLDWGRLRWLLHVAYRSGFHRQRLWVRSGADLSWSRADRKVLGYGRAYTETYIEAPPPVGFNESLFPLPPPWDAGQQEDWIPVTIHQPRRDSGVCYSVADHPRTDDVAVRDDLLKRHAETRQVRLRIEPRVPLWRVVEMIDYLRRHDHDVFLEPYIAEIPPEVLADMRLPGSPGSR